jgi:hypothetical protein
MNNNVVNIDLNENGNLKINDHHPEEQHLLTDSKI